MYKPHGISKLTFRCPALYWGVVLNPESNKSLEQE